MQPEPEGTGSRSRGAIPVATYRLQLHDGFPLAAAAEVAPYLAALGISHVYLSPILQAAPGSTHGYDVVDPTRVGEQLGGAASYRAFADRLAALGLGQVLDLVPNHMAIAPENPWWWDVLENGPSSRYAGVFDVDWEHPEPHLRERILLPILDDHYGRVLEAGRLALEWTGTRFVLAYGDQHFPVAPESVDELLARAAERAASSELAFLAGALGALPPSTASDRPSRERRYRDATVIAARLAALATERIEVAEAIAAVTDARNTDVDALDRLLERQNYRLAWWRSARRDLGYRRFFDVTSLVGLRMEDERVFDETHALVLDWLAADALDGLRVDHPDGLRDPEGYLRRLRRAAPRAWIVVEKILAPGEELRTGWPVDGTTGYDFLDRVQRVLLDPAGERPLTELYAAFTGDERSYDEIVRESKRLVLRDVLGSELGRLTSLLVDVLEAHRRHRDHTRHDLHEALRELLAAFPVYRTYVQPAARDAPPRVDPADVEVVETAVDAAKASRPDLPPDLFDVIGDLLLLRLGGDLEAEFALRFQQLSGPVMAKGVEDTASYRYPRLVALSEVGAATGGWGLEPAAFHAASLASCRDHPATMLATSTHDTKRSEDVRARLLVLSEVPARWAAAIARWSAAAPGRERDTPLDRATEYLVYQTLVGAWPIGEERLAACVLKAVREAKVHTSWTAPDEAYERRVGLFISSLLHDPALAGDIEAFVRSILVAGRVNGLAQVLLKLTAPGVPDVYQGCELWDLSLVDPDNRRPVDFGLRRRLLDRLPTETAEGLTAALADPDDPGRPKLWLVQRALGLRARRPEAFGRGGAYLPLQPRGPRAEHAVAFARGAGPDVVTVVSRLSARLVEQGGWGTTALELPSGRWTDVLTGDSVAGGTARLGDVLARFPVALLERGA